MNRDKCTRCGFVGYDKIIVTLMQYDDHVITLFVLCSQCFQIFTGISLDEFKEPILTNCYLCDSKVCTIYGRPLQRNKRYVFIHYKKPDKVIVLCADCYKKWFVWS